MPARNALTRLAAVAPTAEPSVDTGEEERILEGILASPRRTAARRRALLLVPAGAVVLAAAALAVSLAFGHSKPVASTTNGHRVALTGARIQAAGYHFRTPAGFKASTSSCVPSTSDSGPHGITKSGPVTVMNGFAAAASADGGCVEAFFMLSHDGTTPADNGATPVDVGSYQGYYVPQDASGESTLYVQLPKTADAGASVYLALFAENLTEDQLIAVAQSGLPASP